MDLGNIANKFDQMGARVAVRQLRWPVLMESAARIDIRKDNRGEYFLIEVNPRRECLAQVIDVRPADRHLLLMIREVPFGPRERLRLTKQKFLCGHDERAWFVAAVPE